MNLPLHFRDLCKFCHDLLVQVLVRLLVVLQRLLGDGQPQSLKLSPIDVALGLELSDSRLAVLSQDCGELSEPLLVSLKFLPCIHRCLSIGVVAIK